MIDDLNVVILSQQYSGNPFIGYSPDILIVPENIFDKYSDNSFNIDYDTTKVIMI